MIIDDHVRLDGFAFVGLTEHFDLSVCLFHVPRKNTHCVDEKQLRGTRPFRSLFDVFVSPRVKTRRKLAGRSESLPSVDERSKNDQESSFGL